jgi:hypothetical protein
LVILLILASKLSVSSAHDQILILSTIFSNLFKISLLIKNQFVAKQTYNQFFLQKSKSSKISFLNNGSHQVNNIVLSPSFTQSLINHFISFVVNSFLSELWLLL